MPLTISDFNRLAIKGDDRVIEVGEQNALKSSGFFGRTFRSAGKSETTNQATMKAFVDSIRQEKGDLMANMIKAKFTELSESDRPLSGRLVKAVMAELSHQHEEVRKLNEQFFQRLIYDPGPKGLKAVLTSLLPEGSQIRTSDLEEFASLVRFNMLSCNREGTLMGLDDVRKVADPYLKNLSRVTPEAMARLDAFVEHCADRGLTKTQAESLRSLMIINGVTTEQTINKTVEFFNSFKTLLPRLEACKDGGDLALVYDALNKSRLATFQGVVDGIDPSMNMIPAAIQAAIRTSGRTPDQITGLLTEVIQGRPGSEFCCTSGVLLRFSDDSRVKAPVVALLGLQNTIVDAMGLMLGKSEGLMEELDDSRASIFDSYDRLDEIPQNTARALLAVGLPLPQEIYAPNKDQDFREFLHNVVGQGLIPPDDLHRLLQSTGNAGYPGNLCGMGLGAMFSVLPRLKALEPGPGPFSPQTVWRELFNTPAPATVTPDNLSEAIGDEINKRLIERFDDQIVKEKSVFVFIAIISRGVSWQRAFELLDNPGEIRLADLPVPPAFRLSVPVTWEAERATLAALTKDTSRREGDSSLRIGENEPLPLRQPVPTQAQMDEDMRHMTEEGKKEYLEGVEQLRNYNHMSGVTGEDRGVYNLMADAILRQITELIGNGEEVRAQRIGVLEALTQSTSLVFRDISPLARSSEPGGFLYEHSAYDTTVTKNGDLIIVRLETPPQSPMRGLLEYTVDRAGTIRMTDMVIGTNA